MKMLDQCYEKELSIVYFQMHNSQGKGSLGFWHNNNIVANKIIE